LLLVKKPNITPKQRFQTTYRFLNKLLKSFPFIEKFKSVRRKTLSGHKNLKRPVFFSKTLYKEVDFTNTQRVPYFIQDYQHYNYIIREVSITKNLYGHCVLRPNTLLYYPGFRMYPLN